MAIAPMELGRAVRRWTHSNASFTVIEQTEAREGGWGDGGCWILADALASGFGLEMFGVFGHHVPGIDPTPRLQHVVVKAGKGYIYKDGYQTEATFRRNYLKWEGIAVDSVEPVNRARMEQTKFSRPSMQPAIIAAIKQLLLVAGSEVPQVKPRKPKCKQEPKRCPPSRS
jgi:hypothetical protein